MRKNFFKLFFFVFFISLFFVSPVSADENFTRVRGNVYDVANGGGIGGLTVTVNCQGHVQTPTTDANGLYIADYSHEDCPKFLGVSSSVTHNGQTQSDTVYVSHNYRATMDFYFGATSVPEFGAVGSIVSAIGSGLVFLGIKRKFTI